MHPETPQSDAYACKQLVYSCRVKVARALRWTYDVLMTKLSFTPCPTPDLYIYTSSSTSHTLNAVLSSVLYPQLWLGHGACKETQTNLWH